MKKVFGLFLSLMVLMSLSACKKGHSALTFVSSGESTISLVKEGNPLDISLEYSMDGKNWNPYTMGKTLGLLDGDELSFRAGEQGNDYFSFNDEDYYYFKISGSVAAKGNIMSLLDRNCARNSVPSFAFSNLFFDCTGLTSAPDLPATELAEYCYSGMFAGCMSLISAPTLPATAMAESCYSGMFSGCSNLTNAPKLPAMKLAKSCYAWMFEGCTSLTKAPALLATNLSEHCYSGMFYGCTNLNYVKALFTDEPHEETTYSWLRGVSPTGAFVKSKVATWDVWGGDGIPFGWTVVTE